MLSLFSGIGGIELGLERAGFTTVGQVECDPYCLKVLEKHWPGVPRHDDVRTATEWWRAGDRPAVDVVCGGFPCQDISNAGKREGITGERSGLWFAMADVVRALRPRYVVMENVSAIVNRGLNAVCGTLAEIGYDLEWDCIPAASLSAPHRRDRWWGIAYPTGLGRRQGRAGRPVGRSANGQGFRPETLADPDRSGRSQRRWAGSVQAELATAECGSKGMAHPNRAAGNSSWSSSQEVLRPETLERSGRRGGGFGGAWSVEPSVGRVAHGVPARVDRLKGLGNAVVPQVAEHVGNLLVEFDREVH